MKRFFTLVLIALLVSVPVVISAQCTGGTSQGTLTTTAAWQVQNNADGGRYYSFNTTAGWTYQFSYCAADGGSSTFDTQLTMLDNTGAYAGAYSDDFCGVQSYVSWIAPTTGTYRILSNQYFCAVGPTNNMGNLAYRHIAPTPPNCANPTSPANGAVNVCNSGTTLTWTAPVGGGAPTGYRMYFGTNNLPTNIVNGTNIGNVLLYNTGALLPSTTYYWYVTPTNGAGDAVGCSAQVRSFTTGTGCYIQPTSGTTSVSSCGGAYFDSGNSGLDYSNGESGVTTFCPSIVGQYVQVTFSTFQTEAGLDVLTIYNGNSIAAPVLGTYSGTNMPCVVTSTAVNGCLTFRFVTDGSVTYFGWTATVSCVAVPPGPVVGSTCGNAPAITMPYTAVGQTTLCYGNDYNNLSTGSCGTLYESGEDHVYSLTVGAGTCIGISLTNASTTSIGYQVYSGCPGSVGTTCIGNNGGANPLSGTVTLPAAGTYYIIVDTWSAPNSVNYDISVTNFGAGPVNDLPCSATALALNTNLSGDNSCSGGASEPVAPACWLTPGNLNCVWYSVVCPASGQLKIRTNLGTLTNTQIALYSGTCGALVLVACNDNGPACGFTTYNNSEIIATGLTSGATYWIRVDGVGNLTGTFDILVIDGSTNYPLIAGQDCGQPNPVCTASINVGNPGYQAYGNYCDFPGGGTNCLASGERGSCWYTIPINANGVLTFDIVPNDWPGSPSTFSTDYDFAVWKIAGASSTTCAGIAAGATPDRCNYSGLGVTGLFSNANGTSPGAYPGFGPAYMAELNVNNGDVYVLCISNFSNSTSGFTINFGGASPINYTAAGSTVTWTGGSNTSWTLASNWGGCTPPACGISAIVGPSSFAQPSLPAGNFYANNININAGGTLTLQAGANLHVCGNFSNSGSLVCNPGSTITFDGGAAAQLCIGSLVGADAIGNLVVTKTGGSLTLNNNIDCKGSITMTNGTSVLNMNGRYVKVAGNFTNFNGGTTVTNTAASTLEFNGTAAQTYTQGASLLTLNNVLMNHTGPGVTCATNMVLGTAGTLTLTLGRIITNAFEVQVTNNASAACTPGNAASFVQGNLRRYLNGAATSYDLPVGSPTTGYQRANITFTTVTTIPQLLARFDNYAPPIGPFAAECPTNTYDAMAMLNNGYWTITASANPTSGTYNTTLYSTNYTNSAGALGWTVAKGASTATYSLNGTCVGTSTASNTQRTGMNGFSVFGVAQSSAPLPVELISFTGETFDDHNGLNWATASELNNHYFDVERSDDGITFSPIGRKEGGNNSSQRLDYSFDDYSPIEGINYYRLKQVDYNGAITYSNVVSLIFHRGNMSVSNVKPNPTNGEVNFDFNSPSETTIHIVITDVTGRKVKDEYMEVKAGTSIINTMIDETGAGVYTLSVTEEKSGFRSVSRIIKY